MHKDWFKTVFDHCLEIDQTNPCHFNLHKKKFVAIMCKADKLKPEIELNVKKNLLKSLE